MEILLVSAYTKEIYVIAYIVIEAISESLFVCVQYKRKFQGKSKFSKKSIIL